MKKGLFSTVMLVSVLALGYSQDGSWNVTNVATWIEAVNGIRSGGNNKEYAITVTGNISVPSSPENTFGSVTGVTITIQGNGTLSPSANGSLLYIGSGQTIIAKDLTLRGRNANNTSAIFIENGGTLRMEGRAIVTGNVNTASDAHGGGVYVAKGGTLTMQDNTTISGNISANTSLYINSSVSHSGGGGVYVNEGNFTMQGSASVSGNSSNGTAGGVHVNNGKFTMRGNATVSDNIVNPSVNRSWNVGVLGYAASGGGVYVRGGAFTMQDNALVSGNNLNGRKDSDDNAYGGGVYIDVSNETFTMQGSASVTGNTSNGGGGKSFGGGVFVGSSTFTMQGNASVSNNTAKSSGNRANSYGGGVYIYERGSFSMRDSTSVSGNTADGDGGGVSVFYGNFNRRAFSMEGGTISGNTANGKGGGVFLRKDGGDGPDIFTMQGNASVTGNTASSDGGGVYASIGGPITLIMQGNASVSNNTSNRNGGGVAHSGGGWNEEGTLTMRENAIISGNTANYGGGVIFYNGRINMEGGTISGNIAKNSGGGVYLNGGNFTKTSGNLYGYDAPLNLANRGTSANAIYDEKGGRWRNITAGSTMNSDTYGFWLNDEVEFKFPSEFIGTWKRANFNNTLTFTEKNITISSNSYRYELLGISGDSYSMKRSSANPFTLAFKLTSGNLVISGDSGNGQDNWNGTWVKQ